MNIKKQDELAKTGAGGGLWEKKCAVNQPWMGFATTRL